MRLALLIGLPLAIVTPGGAGANPIGCGGDASSSAEVVRDARPSGERPAPRAIVAAPDTLCGDLSDDRAGTTSAPNIDVVIGQAPTQGGTALGSPQGSLPGPGRGGHRSRP